MPLTSSKPELVIWSHDAGQQIPCFDSCQLTTTWIFNIIYVTFHAKTYFNGFPFSNGIPFRGRFKAVSKKFAFVRTTWVIRSKKFTSVRTPLITRSTETASRSNDLLTRSVKVSTRSNDLLTRSIKVVQPFKRLAHPFVKNIQPFERLTRLLEHPSVQTT